MRKGHKQLLGIALVIVAALAIVHVVRSRAGANGK